MAVRKSRSDRKSTRRPSSRTGLRVKTQRVSIIGLGYVGLSTAVCFANRGLRVHGVEIDRRKCDLISGGKSPIHEQDIDSYLSDCIRDGSLSCTSDIREAVLNSEITFLTVGTPSKPDGGIDLTYVEAAAREVGRILAEKKTYHLVVVKSTVVPGTTAGIVKDSLEMGSKKLFPKDFGLCFNPEFLREGTAIHDTLRPDALVIGAEDERSSETLLNLYKSFYGVDRVPDTLVTKIPNAEFVKYSVNTFRATQLSFLNSLANLCEKIPSADVSEVTKGLSVVTKIDSRYLRAGFGYGGSCLPKDLRALTALFQRLDVDSSLLLSVAEINQKQPLRAVEIAKQLVGDLRANRIAVLGLAFKAGTDDIRESVGVRIVVELLSLGARVNVYDPQALENAKHVFESSVEFAQSTKSCLRGAQCCIVATDWEEFRKIPPSIFKNEMRNPIIIDGCHVLDSKAFESSGVFVYEIGRNSGDQALRSTISPMIGNSLV